MTDEQIVQALEWYKKLECGICYDVGMLCHIGNGDCIVTLAETILDLIQRQQAEIERLTAEHSTGINELLVIVEDDIRAEAIKWFADKLKARIDKIVFKYGRYCESEEIDKLVKDIDDLVKEMVGADDV